MVLLRFLFHLGSFYIEDFKSEKANWKWKPHWYLVFYGVEQPGLNFGSLFLLFLSWSTRTMSEKITAEDLLNNITEALAEHGQKVKSVSFFGEDNKSASVTGQIQRIFGRQKPVYHLLGGGKCMSLFVYSQSFFIFQNLFYVTKSYYFNLISLPTKYL